MILWYRISFKHYWHIGSGLSGGAASDALIIKDQQGLPFVPGKSLKGHLRESAEWLVGVDPSLTENTIQELFGSPSELKGADGLAQSFISSAHLHPEEAKLFKESSKESLVQNISSTALDQNGVAVDNSLRSIEVAIPLNLYGQVHLGNPKHLQALRLILGATKYLGANKNRGLGLCNISLIEN